MRLNKRGEVDRRTLPKHRDLVGQVFGRLTVLSLAHVDKKHRAAFWNCRCECGRETIKSSSSLTTGNVRSCGCLKSEMKELPVGYEFAGQAPNARPVRVVREDFEMGRAHARKPFKIGQRIGQLTVTGFLVGLRGGLLAKGILAKCSCGGPEAAYMQGNLNSKKETYSCHLCAVRRAVETRKQYVGYRDVIADDEIRTGLLSRINSIYRRCHEPGNNNYYGYGGRGIHCWWYLQYGVGAVRKIDKAVWRRKMLEYLVTLDGWDKPGLEIDRIDNSRGYEPGNLRFVSRKQNMQNRRKVWQLEARILELEAEVARLQSIISNGGKQNDRPIN